MSVELNIIPPLGWFLLKFCTFRKDGIEFFATFGRFLVHLLLELDHSNDMPQEFGLSAKENRVGVLRYGSRLTSEF